MQIPQFQIRNYRQNPQSQIQVQQEATQVIMLHDYPFLMGGSTSDFVDLCI